MRNESWEVIKNAAPVVVVVMRAKGKVSVWEERVGGEDLGKGAVGLLRPFPSIKLGLFVLIEWLSDGGKNRLSPKPYPCVRL